MCKLQQVLTKYRKYHLLERKEKFLFLEALALNLWVGLLLKIIPFRWIPGLFSSPQSAVGSRQPAVIELIRDAIQRAEKVSPWRNKCMVSSLAARCMLRRRKIESQLSLGVAKNDAGRTIAHAWISVGEDEIVPRGVGYTELYFF